MLKRENHISSKKYLKSEELFQLHFIFCSIVKIKWLETIYLLIIVFSDRPNLIYFSYFTNTRRDVKHNNVNPNDLFVLNFSVIYFSWFGLRYKILLRLMI